jgi:hypothetical protein
MRIRKLIVVAGFVALPIAGLVATAPAEASSNIQGPCQVQLGSPGPSVGSPTYRVNPSTGEVYFKAGHIDSGHLDPHVECFGTLVL